MPFRLIRNVRSLQRLRTIAQVLTRHGFGHLVELIDLGRFVPLWMKPQAKRSDVPHDPHHIGERLARVATELGPTFVKLGQMLSTRPDLLPPNIIEGLTRLQDHVEPFSTEEARKLIEEDLGVSITAAFRSFEDHPFASGSIAQVYRAVADNGQPVVVKVQRPDIEERIRSDMHILIAMAEALESYVPELRMYHPSQIFEEFHRSITGELDFVNEASSTSRFHSHYAADGTLGVPQVRWDLTGTRVLTMEWLDGTSLQQLLAGTTDGFQRTEIARSMASAFLVQFFETGLFHADPHPGNILVSPPNRISLIDFGVVGQVSEELMTQLVVALLAAVNRQTDWVVDVVSEVGQIGPESDVRDLKRDMQCLLDKYHGLPLKRLDLPRIFVEVTDVVRRNDISLPPSFVMMAKSLAMVSGTVLQLDPEFDLVSLLKPKLKSLIAKRFSPNHLLKSAGLSMWHLLNIAKSAPGQLRQLIRSVARGHMQIRIQHQNLDRLARELDRASNRLAFALIIAAMVVGSSMMLASGATTVVLGIQLEDLGLFGYLVAGIMGLGLIWAIFRSGRLY